MLYTTAAHPPPRTIQFQGMKCRGLASYSQYGNRPHAYSRRTPPWTVKPYPNLLQKLCQHMNKLKYQKYAVSTYTGIQPTGLASNGKF